MNKKGKTFLSTRKFQQAMHQSKVLSLIRTAKLISRTDLSIATGLSQASVTGITAKLIADGLVEEKQAGVYEGGRPPILLAIKSDGVHVIGVNFNLNRIEIVIINFKAEIKASVTISTGRAYYSPEEIIEYIIRGIQTCLQKLNFSNDQVAGVGVGIPGPVDAVSGIIRFLPNYDWKKVPFRKMLGDKIDHPVFIDNNANTIAIAEYWYGNGKGVDNFITITLGNGVGAGIILNGELIRGHIGIAGEFGHVCVDPFGPFCRCGRKGCLETYTGSNAIIKKARALAVRGSWFSSKVSPDELHFEDVIAELEYDNDELRAIYAEAGAILGIGIYNLIALLNPEMVIITGEGVTADDFIFTPMFNIMENLKADQADYSQTKIVIKKWHHRDWARGSGTLALREIYKSPAVN
jgi:predicted NBD/HSP70 family sugar kinase